jgi:isoleucyl-tRNA synthetase
MSFKSLPPQVDFGQLEKQISEYWTANNIPFKYLKRNQKSKKKFSFLDGPITANNPMGVHHAWGRTYKDLWQRYFTLKGFAGRFQNGFDCQGLWVEVEVEKELGFKNKKDIETYGVANFVEKCKERVIKYSGIQTQQSQRLAYFMDWDNSYFTMSDKNNYSIWEFLKLCWQKGWIYKGHDSVPWCPRCETAISQHEMLTEDYKEITHDSIYLELPIVGKSNEFLLVWTTTPWTLPANIAVAVDTTLDYSLVRGSTGFDFWLAAGAVDRVFSGGYQKILKTVKGKNLVGVKYRGPFDHLPVVEEIANQSNLFHTIIPTDDKIMPISSTEGTGLVHTAVSAGAEDYKLGQKLGLPMIPVIADNADYLDGLGEFSGKNAKKDPRIILDYLQKRDQNGENWVFEISPYTHRYPACWRCKTELVWKIADEWYIAMDKNDPFDAKRRTYRQQMIAITKKIKWIPEFGLDRELDWLKNMHDWLISKKNRYWGLALPIYECRNCGRVEVIGSVEELKEKAYSGWDVFSGHSPHKPWIDEVKIMCPQCGQSISRIPDVGNPWLDAGIVSVSTLPSDWYPADFITESFPGQFKNWFYSLIAMSTVMKNQIPFKQVLGFASLLAEDGRPMHKSWGNSIEFNEGADKIGVDVMRWIYTSHNPEQNLLFGYKKADEVRRQFLLILWNIYNFFVTYAKIDGFDQTNSSTPKSTNVLDIWISERLNQTVEQVTESLDKFDALSASKNIEKFVNDLSLWFVRRSRGRVGPTVENSPDKTSCHLTLYRCLTTLSIIMAPFTPYLSEEIFTNLTGQESVHLSDWPKINKSKNNQNQIFQNMEFTRKIVELGLASRKELSLKVRQPLANITITGEKEKVSPGHEQLIMDELNIKAITWQSGHELSIVLDTALTPELIEEGKMRDLLREVQEARKLAGAKIDQSVKLTVPLPQNSRFLKELQIKTLAAEIRTGDKIEVELV